MKNEENLKIKDEELKEILKLDKLKKTDLIRIARTNVTYSNENGNVKHNEELAYLGDAILKFILADEYYRKGKIKEIFDTNGSFNLIINEHLKNIVEKRLNMLNYLLISDNGKKQKVDKNEEHIGDFLEALIAVVYLDSGRSIKKTREFLINNLDILNFKFDPI